MMLGDFARRVPRHVLSCAAAILAGTAFFAAPTAAKVKTIYAFCALDNCADGSSPTGRLLRDSAGNLYGATYYSEFGSSAGTIFMVSPTGQLQTLHAFCSQDGCADGAEPQGSLIMDTNGNLYGATYSGGVGGQGVAFELLRKGKKWKFAKLYDFCAKDQCSDGGNPYKLTYQGDATGALYDGASPLYGTAYNYGPNGGGALFELDVIPDKNKRRVKIVYAFCSQANCTDGQAPTGITFDAQGHIIGATGEGGANGKGTLFQISGKKETVLYSFCPSGDCSQGNFPQGVTIDANGDFFGTASNGGAHDYGAVFKFSPATSTYTVLHDFCSKNHCADGALPLDVVTIGPNGDLFGTTLYGGADESCCGVAYMLHEGVQTVLHTFCAKTCTEGAFPEGGVIFDGAGNIFGTAGGGGNEVGGGTIWELTP